MQPLINIDFRSLVNNVADQFEAETGFKVNPLAREKLIEPALPYKDQVEKELASGQITLYFLEESIRTVLSNAMEIARARGRSAVGEDTTIDSMKQYCPYLFWC